MRSKAASAIATLPLALLALIHAASVTATPTNVLGLYSVVTISGSGTGYSSSSANTNAGISGYADGGVGVSRWSVPTGLSVSCSDPDDTLYVTEYEGDLLRTIKWAHDSNATTSFIAGYLDSTGNPVGSVAGTYATVDGAGTNAKFAAPAGVVRPHSRYVRIAADSIRP